MPSSNVHNITSTLSKACAILLSLLILNAGLVAQQPAALDIKLARVEFVGLKRFKAEQLLKASGLELGQSVNLDALDAAAQKLLDSGLVHKLSYRFQTKADQGTVIFQIEEGHGGESNVIFDNFVSFTDEELSNAVRREVPSFGGMAPTSGQMTDAIIRALQQFLREKKVEGAVEYLPSEGLDRTKIEHVFRLKGPKLPICSLHFPGARHVEEEQLIKTSHELIGTDYSRSFVSMFSYSNLFQLYKELGHLRALFGKPQAVPQSTSTCNGVELTVPVEEGSIYVWDKAGWTGNTILKTADLEKDLGMQSGEIANGIKFDTGIGAVLKAYARKGFLEASVRPQADFDDAARKVAYRLDVKEGTQYHMGALIIKGFSDNLGNYLRGKWEMRKDDVYDQGYVDEFFKNDFKEIMKKVVEERQSENRPAPKKYNTLTRPNRETLTVDITFELTDE
ncbi:MAG TPA: POTRA domain-containing protein [Pyrinomonadaceae bacterium]|nr:POTRA domain-containing protein [Pyrinomonadaceae bacterium]